jgi:hypothetical protein
LQSSIRRSSSCVLFGVLASKTRVCVNPLSVSKYMTSIYMGKDSFKPLVVKPVPVPKLDHPEAPNDVLPKHEFTLGLIARIYF